MKIQDVYDEFMLEKRVNGLTGEAMNSYRWQLLPFVRAHGKDQIEELTQRQIYEFLLGILDKDLADATKSSYIRSVRIFLRWCSMEYPVLYRYEKIKVPRMPKKKIRMYTDEELLMVFNAVSGVPEWIRLRNMAMVAVFYDSGIRRAEACALRRSDLDLANGRMMVTGKGKKQRFVPVGQVVRLFLEAYLAACPYDHDRVFVSRSGAEMSLNSVSQMMHDLQVRLPFKISPHKLRHNFATNYCLEKYAAGDQVDPLLLKVLMGHEDLVTTQRYLHMASELVAVKGCVSALDKKFPGIRTLLK